VYRATNGAMSPPTKCSTDIISTPHRRSKSMSSSTSGDAKIASGERTSARTAAVPGTPRFACECRTTTGS
jgi:hypothetical protein